MRSGVNRNGKRVLFLVRQYAPIPKVCEICVKRVRRALYEQGVKSDVLQFTGNEGVVETLPIGNVYSIGAGEGKLDTTFKNEFAHFLKKASVAYRWPFFFSHKLNAKFKKRIIELNDINDYDAIIGIALPIDTAVAGIGFENFIFYELDAITNNPQNSGLVKSILRYRVKIIEKAVFDSASLIIHMECNRDYFKKERYSAYKNKSIYSDIPNLIRFSNKDTVHSPDKILCAYFGSLDKSARNPEYLIKIMESIKYHTDIICEFYSRGNCEDVLKNAEAENPKVIRAMGYVAQAEVKKNQMRADFLLSIGNKLTGEDRALPSKILEYMSIGKPIIHIHGGCNDSAIPYLKQYELACIVNPDNGFSENVLKVSRFIKESLGKRIAFDNIKDLFYRNSPDYTANIIMDFLERSSL